MANSTVTCFANACDTDVLYLVVSPKTDGGWTRHQLFVGVNKNMLP